MIDRLKRVATFVVGVVQDPKSCDLSSARLVAIGMCIAGVVFAFKHPSEAATATAIIGGGGVSILSRTKSE